MSYVILSLLGGLCIYFSCINLLPQRLYLIHRIIILTYVIISCCVLNHYIGQYFAFLTIMGTLLFIYFFSSSKWLSLSCALFGYLFSVSINHLFIWCLQCTVNMSLQQIYEYEQIALIFSLFYCAICYICTKLLGYLFHSVLKIDSMFNHNDLSKGIFFTMVVVSILFIFNISYGEAIGYSYSAIAFNGILFLILFISIAILVFFLYRNIQQTQQDKHMYTQYEQLQNYTNEVEQLYCSMRSFKHDYINILTTLSVYIEQENFVPLKKFFYEEILPISQDFSHSDNKLGTLSQIQNLELKSLLSSKFIFAMESGISIELELPDKIENFPMKGIDLCKILGIFLDNAIEAASQSKEKTIAFLLFFKSNSLVLVLTNSSFAPDIPISSLSNWGVSTKGENRGIGLFNVKQTLNTYNNVTWDMEYQNPYFKQTLTMYYTGKECL